MEIAQHEPRLHQPDLLRCFLGRIRNLLLHPLMRASGVKVGHILAHDAPEVRLSHDEDVIQAFPAQAAKAALAHISPVIDDEGVGWAIVGLRQGGERSVRIPYQTFLQQAEDQLVHRQGGTCPGQR